MRKKFKLVFWGLLVLAGCGISQAKVLVVTPKTTENPAQKINLTVESKINLLEKTFEFISVRDEAPKVFNYTDVRHLSFGEGEAGGDEPSANRPAGQTGRLSLVSNPVGNILRIKGYDGGRTNVQIFNVNGNRIFSSAWQGEDLNVSRLTSGLYFIKINSQTIKFIKK